MEEGISFGLCRHHGQPKCGKIDADECLVGTKVAVLFRKGADNARNKVVGILTTEEYQIVFLDTPGLHTPKPSWENS